MKTRFDVLFTLVILITMFLTVDMITTVFGLSLGATEKNFVADYLIRTFPVIGYFFSLMFIVGLVTILILSFSFLLETAMFIGLGRFMTDYEKSVYYVVCASIYMSASLLAIANNIGVIIKLWGS